MRIRICWRLLDFFRYLQDLQEGDGVVESANGIAKRDRFANVGNSHARIGWLLLFGSCLGLRNRCFVCERDTEGGFSTCDCFRRIMTVGGFFNCRDFCCGICFSTTRVFLSHGVVHRFELCGEQVRLWRESAVEPWWLVTCRT